MKQWKRSQPYLEPGCTWYNLTDLTVFASGYTRLAFQSAFFAASRAYVVFLAFVFLFNDNAFTATTFAREVRYL